MRRKLAKTNEIEESNDSSERISREEAIRRYKESQKLVAEEVTPEETPLSEIVESAQSSNDDVELESIEELEKEEGQSQLEEFDPDGDQEIQEGEYKFGWGYNDSFDNPEEDEDVPLDELDEDELYARSSTKKED